MSNPKWLIFLFTVWIGIGFLCTIFEGVWYSAEGEEETVMNTLLTLPVFTEGIGVRTVIGTIFSADAWSALFTVMILDFAFFEGSTEIVRWVIFFPITIGIIIPFGFYVLAHIPIIGRGGG